jgi:hypothetical protein
MPLNILNRKHFPNINNPTPVTPANLEAAIALAGGQTVVMANGTYSCTGASVTTAHSTPLVLVPETAYGVTIDLSTAGGQKQLKMYTGVTNVVFVGMNFINGTMQLAGAQNITFWYCTFTYPPAVWRAQYLAGGGVYPSNNTTDRNAYVAAGQMNTQPSCIRIRGTLPTAGGNTQSIAVYGCDFNDVTDDACIISLIDGFTWRGNRVWDVNEHDTIGSVDPGDSFGSGSLDWFHEDGFQINGTANNIIFSDSWEGEGQQIGVGTDIQNAAFSNNWYAGCSGFGHICASTTTGNLLNCTEDTVWAFANGQTSGSSSNHYRTDFHDGVQEAVWPSSLNIAGQHEFTSTHITDDGSIPSGINYTTVAGRPVLTDINEVKNHASNPANVWRVTNPYGNYVSYLGL